MYSRMKKTIVLSYSLMLWQHCGKTHTHTQRAKQKERESDPVVVFWPPSVRARGTVSSLKLGDTDP